MNIVVAEGAGGRRVWSRSASWWAGAGNGIVSPSGDGGGGDVGEGVAVLMMPGRELTTYPTVAGWWQTKVSGVSVERCHSLMYWRNPKSFTPLTSSVLSSSPSSHS